MNTTAFFKTTVCLLTLSWHSLSFANIIDYFNSIKTDPVALYSFLEKMPKGGELHYHLGGGAYTEGMLKIATRENYCLNTKTFAVTEPTKRCPGMSLHHLSKHKDIYEKTIQAWSMKHFSPKKESGHDHFFNSFSKFGPIVSHYGPELLTDIMQRAANQHELYLEIMLLADGAHSASFGSSGLLNKGYSEAKNKLLANQAFQDNIQATIHASSTILQKARQQLGCPDALNTACQLTIKFQYYVLREQPTERVFAQALNGFEAASRSKDIVAVNLVQPEDGILSLKNYHQQMAIFAFLHQAYPNVHISLHAGELTPKWVKPHDLTFHMNEAIHLAHAERIGHGTSIHYENDAEALLKTMAEKQIPVEINLTSNQKILTIQGQAHPLNSYLRHHVPVVLSTDDEGILRTNLTYQYVEAVYRHHIDYPTLKQINRNTLTYSFLPGKSLWANPMTTTPVPECSTLKSQRCLAFIQHNPKATLQWELENDLMRFEAAYVKTGSKFPPLEP